MPNEIKLSRVKEAKTTLKNKVETNKFKIANSEKNTRMVSTELSKCWLTIKYMAAARVNNVFNVIVNKNKHTEQY